MGYIRHHAIIVTTWKKELLSLAHEKAKEIFRITVSEIIRSPLNDYYSFFIAPDGSKEERSDSYEGDKKRKQFIEWIHEQVYEDGGNALKFVEVFYGDDGGKSQVETHN